MTADRGFTWSDDETSLLLELWGANDAQSELSGNKRNFPVYEKISESMISMGYMRTASQCREKIKRMKREYSLAKQQHDKRCGPKKNMRFYEQFHKILLEKQMRIQNNAMNKLSPKIAEPEAESKESTSKRSWDDNENKVGVRLRSQKTGDNSEKEEGNAWTPDVLLVEGEDNPESLFDTPVSPSGTSGNSRDISSEKGLPQEIPYLKCMMDTLLAKLMKYQTESDSRILSKMEELENERTAMDERLHRMWIDFEEKRRNDEREHELNVMKIFQDVMNQMNENRTSKD